MLGIVEVERVEQGMLAALGERVRYLRRLKGMTQGELGTRAGIDRKSVNSLENAVYAPTFRVVTRVALALDVSLHLLLAPLETWRDFVAAAGVEYRGL